MYPLCMAIEVDGINQYENIVLQSGVISIFFLNMAHWTGDSFITNIKKKMNMSYPPGGMHSLTSFLEEML